MAEFKYRSRLFERFLGRQMLLYSEYFRVSEYARTNMNPTRRPSTPEGATYKWDTQEQLT